MGRPSSYSPEFSPFHRCAIHRTGESRTSVPRGISVLHDGLSSPGAGRVGISVTRAVTRCFPAPGDVSMNRSFPGCIPACHGGLPYSGVGIGQRFHEPDGHRLCSGPRRQTTMSQGWNGRRFHESVDHRLRSGVLGSDVLG